MSAAEMRPMKPSGPGIAAKSSPIARIAPAPIVAARSASPPAAFHAARSTPASTSRRPSSSPSSTRRTCSSATSSCCSSVPTSHPGPGLEPVLCPALPLAASPRRGQAAPPDGARSMRLEQPGKHRARLEPDPLPPLLHHEGPAARAGGWALRRGADGAACGALPARDRRRVPARADSRDRGDAAADSEQRGGFNGFDLFMKDTAGLAMLSLLLFAEVALETGMLRNPLAV